MNGVRFCVVRIRHLKLVAGLAVLVVLVAIVLVWMITAGTGGILVGSSPDGVIYRGPTDRLQMSLTFNVDWGTELIEPMLAVLEEKEVQATFFLTGSWASKFPETARRIAIRHEIGNHGRRHTHPKSLSDAQLRELIAANEELLAEITGQSNKLFAPPYGEIDGRIAQVARELGFRSIMWTIDTVDWKNPSAQTIIDRVVGKAKPGAIVLMHPKENTLQALPELIDRLKGMGFTLVPVGTLLDSI